MFCGKVEICGVNTSQLKVLSGKETKALLLKAKEGDKKARESLVSGNLKLILSVIRRFSSRGESPDLLRPSTISTYPKTCNFPHTLFR